ncbi:MAG: cytochrome d ubiquinol oxidase subunit II [Candidatus Baltobacteraceae bacterium]
MSGPTLLALLIVLLCIVLYALLGGADYGGGAWDMLATGSHREEQREAIGQAMGPVWETNHMWLIFAMVTLFTCFPPVFAKLSVALFVPLLFALAGIIMRGAAFAFRGPSTRDLLVHKFWGIVFGIASLLTPFLFGAAVAGIATGTFDWLAPFSMAVGLLATTLCAQLAAVFLCAETRHQLQDDFRLRALIVTPLVAAIGLGALVLSRSTNTLIFNGLERAWAAVGVAMLAGILVFWFCWSRKFLIARLFAGLEVSAIVAGWYVAEGPNLQINLGLKIIAAPSVTIVTYLWIALAGTLLLVPSLWLLFSVFKREVVDA